MKSLTFPGSRTLTYAVCLFFLTVLSAAEYPRMPAAGPVEISKEGAAAKVAQGTPSIALRPSGPDVVPVTPSRALTFEERVEYQRRIEEVYWRHTTWPEHNPTPKPPLFKVMSAESIRSKVDDYLRKSAALETFWQRPITAEQLQAEMERMARSTRQPSILRQLHEALDDDPFLIAECLARPVLANQLLRSRYANDDRFHGEVRDAAESAMAGAVSAASLATLGQTYRVVVLELEREGAQRASATPSAETLDGDSWSEGTAEQPATLRLDKQEWAIRVRDIARRFGVRVEVAESGPERPPAALGSERPVQDLEDLLQELPVGKVSRLEENTDGWSAMAVLSKGARSIELGIARWPKRDLGQWWREIRPTLEPATDPADGSYRSAHASFDSSCVPETWTIDAQSPPVGRYGHTTVWTGSRMIIWGGYAEGNLNTGGSYDPATDSWIPTSTDGAPSGRSSHTAVWTGSCMIVWGGFDENSGGLYDPATDSWTPTTTDGAPSERSGHTAIWGGDRMIVWGGLRYEGTTQIWENTGGLYDPATDSWAPTTTEGVPSGRHDHTATWTGSRMIVWGGYYKSDVGSPISANTGGSYDPLTDAWTPVSLDGAPSGRYRHTAIWTGSRVFVWGGIGEGQNRNNGKLYNPATDSWSWTTAAGAPSPRHDHTAIWTGSQMIVWGGEEDLSYADTGGSYDPVAHVWTSTSIEGSPVKRSDHTAIWTGSRMIVWGGSGQRHHLDLQNTGGSYDPVTDSWTPTSIEGSPSTPLGHTAIWTGSRMIVWGGDDTDTGALYDPATASWLPTTTDGAPSPRSGHTAIWTGSRMIVWGGIRGFNRTDTGGLYDPATDSWTPTSTAGAPSEPTRHTAVWTGSRMIVWGGEISLSCTFDCCQRVSTESGAAYDPTTDTWSPTSLSGAPSKRCDHTAVWTGSRMIVWGGVTYEIECSYIGGDYYLARNVTNTGASYDPLTDAWTPSSVGSVPSERWGHTALWAGDAMIVWGGASGFLDASGGGANEPTVWTDTGGLYDLATDSWTATAMSGVPSRRSAHSAIWTGGQMIVWGGSRYETSPGIVENSGGLYDPATDGWSPTTTEGAPAGRESHTAVWTGDEMLVWGGAPRSIQLGAYCGPDQIVNVPGDVGTIQGGIDAVAPGGLVIVEPGVYNETIDFGGKNLTLRSTVPDDPTVVSNTVIDGTGLDDSVVRCVSGEGTDTVLAGFTVTGGDAFEGGGMRIVDSSPIVRDCVFTGNEANDGGGMYNLRSSPTVSGCTFADNVVSTDGGGMHNEDSNPFLLSCTFRRNNALSGAGMYNEDSAPAVVDSIFIENTAMRIFDLFAAGGGMCNVRSDPTVVNGLFIGNVAQGGGFGGGGALYNWDSSPRVINSTFSGNSGEFGDAGGIYSRNNSNPVVDNSILWDDVPPEIVDAFGAVTTVRFSDVEGGWVGAGNITLDPVFVDPDGPDGDPNTFGDNDYRLSGGSPCIDAADNTVVPGVIVADLDGKPRFVDDPDTPDTGIGVPPVVDMGAYEYAPAPGPGEVTGLMVDQGPDPSRLTLTWELSCNPGADYGVYEGTLLSLRAGVYDHGPLVCSDASPFLEETIVTTLGDTYYLVVPLDASAEGSHGTRRIDGVIFERPVGATQCAATQMLGCP